MIDYNNIIYISKNLGVFFNSGIPVDIALDEIADTCFSKRYKNSLEKIKNSISKGMSLSSAFSIDDKLYPDIFRIMINIGENTGNLGDILNKISEYYLKIKKERSKRIGALIYPFIVTAAVIAFSILYIIFLLPSLEQMYSGMGKKARGIMMIMIKLGKYLRNNMEAAICIFISVILTFVLILSFSSIRNLITKFKLKFSSYKIQKELFFVRILYLLSSSGIPINIGIQKFISCRLSSIITHDEISKFYDCLSKGNSLSNSVKQCFQFSRLTSSLISIGEETGTLNDKLYTICNNLEQKYYEKLSHITSMIQPLFLVILGIIILCMFMLIYNSIYGGVL